MGGGGLKAVSDIDGVALLVPAPDKGGVQRLRQRSGTDDHQGGAVQVPKVGGQTPVGRLVEAVRRLDVAIVVEGAVVGRVQEHEVRRLGHVEELEVVRAE